MNKKSFDYAVRVSRKARSVRLKMSFDRGLEVVVPRGFDHRLIPNLLASKQNWIESTRQRLDEHRKRYGPVPSDALPDRIELTALGESWQVEYQKAPTRWATARRQREGLLVVRGNTDNARACKIALRRWLAKRSQDSLVPWLRAVGNEKTLIFGRAVVRKQKTRWGSCSRKKSISLNLKLLFLPPEMVRYVFIHELCHTVHMNHSAEYWRFVALQEPAYAELDRRLRSAWQLVPGWV